MKPLHSLWPSLLLAIGVSYFWIDRPLCEFIHTHNWPQYLSPLRYPAGWPPIMTGLAPFLLLASLGVKQESIRKTLILLSLSVLFAFVLKNDLKWVFSRYWPLTWTHDNLSWISNHAYGFQWFQGEIFQGRDSTGSFPSGHSTIAFATFISIALVFRRLLPYCIALASLEALSMVAFDYHFLSDVLAGALVGTGCALFIHSTIELKNPRKSGNP